MTQEEFKAQQRSKEDIELLISELCQRMPYGIKLQKREEEDTVYTLYSINLQSNELCFWKYKGESLRIADIGRIHRFGIPLYKPYLFPMSSITEEQKEELCILCDWHDDKNDAKSILILYQGQFVMNTNVIDWFHKHHLDWRNLIPKGLAIDATGLNIY